jgi:hypothetical protein
MFSDLDETADTAKVKTMAQVKGMHGATQGFGTICMPKGTSMVFVEYRYDRRDDGHFYGSVSTWNHEQDGAGLVAVMSRALPTRAAMLDWIFKKADKVSEA